jgi:hypothetical protein
VGGAELGGAVALVEQLLVGLVHRTGLGVDLAGRLIVAFLEGPEAAFDPELGSAALDRDGVTDPGTAAGLVDGPGELEAAVDGGAGEDQGG